MQKCAFFCFVPGLSSNGVTMMGSITKQIIDESIAAMRPCRDDSSNFTGTSSVLSRERKNKSIVILERSIIIE